jgi:hypothetical protein
VSADKLPPAGQPRSSNEEFTRRAKAIYDEKIHPLTRPGQEGQVVAFDIETGAFEIDQDEHAAYKRLVARAPDAEILTVRVGFLPVHRIMRPLGGSQ